MDAPLLITTDGVLSQATRARLFAMLGELGRPAGTVELADRLDLHPNGVRIHLERLEQAGLVDGLLPDARLTDFVARNPDTARLHNRAWPQSKRLNPVCMPVCRLKA